MIEDYFINHNYKFLNKKNKKGMFVTKYSDYQYLIEYNFTIKELKDLSKRLKLKKCNKKTKKELLNYYTNILYLSNYALKIQRLWRKHFICLFNKTLGPSYNNYTISNNIDDFLT